MSPTRISIDFCVTPIKVGGSLHGQYIVAGGAKALNLTGSSAPTTEEVVEALEDARDVVKGSFGAPGFDAAVVVIPNTISVQDKRNLISHWRGGVFNITQVIQEQIAVTAAYIEKERPEKQTTIAIISATGGILDVSVIDVRAVDARTVKYNLILKDHKFHTEAINFEESKGSSRGGLIGAVVKTLVFDPFEKALHVLENVLGSLNIGNTKVEKLVFVGKASRSEKLRQASKKNFPGAEEWEGIDNPEELAAYGAAFLSYMDKKLGLGKS